MSPILIIGAGACGLMAARELIKKGKEVIILEARNRLGGRIHTIRDGGFKAPAEEGAEFIHGKLPLTLALLKEAKIQHYAMEGQPYEFAHGRLQPSSFNTEGWDVMAQQLKYLEHDITISAFLDRYFGGKDYESLRKKVIQFASGYDAADPDRASSFALRDEWLSDNDEEQYRIEGGYGNLIGFLVKEIQRNGGIIHLSSVVREIQWQNGNVTVITADQKACSAHQVIITVPLGVLQQADDREGSIRFSPALPEKMMAARQMGYGAIIKILLQFQDAFWKNIPRLFSEDAFDSPSHSTLHDMSFIFSEEKIPTWWTQFPNPSALLTGWLGGPAAGELKNMDDEILLSMALKSLGNIFHLDQNALKEKLMAHHISNWAADPFSRGAYAYATVQTPQARRELNKPVEETLFFAGEALYEGTEMGKVEAALVSAKNTTKLFHS